MIAIIKDNMEALQQVCKDMAVSKLYLFGSAARENDYTEDSDIDFLFRFDDKVEHFEKEAKPDYLDLLFKLEKILQKNIDLVWIDGITNPYFIQSIKKDLLPIYAA